MVDDTLEQQEITNPEESVEVEKVQKTPQEIVESLPNGLRDKATGIFNVLDSLQTVEPVIADELLPTDEAVTTFVEGIRAGYETGSLDEVSTTLSARSNILTSQAQQKDDTLSTELQEQVEAVQQEAGSSLQKSKLEYQKEIRVLKKVLDTVSLLQTEQ